MEIAAFLEFFFPLKLGHGLLRVINTRKWLKNSPLSSSVWSTGSSKNEFGSNGKFSYLHCRNHVYYSNHINILTCIMFSTALVFVIKPESK